MEEPALGGRALHRGARRARPAGLAGFVGELVILIGVYQAGFTWPAIVALVAIVLAAAYMLRLYQGIMNGPEVADVPVRPDLTWIEGIAVAPLLAALVCGCSRVDPRRRLRCAVMTIPFTHADWNAVTADRACSRPPRSSCCSPISSRSRTQRYSRSRSRCSASARPALLAAHQYGTNYDAFFGGFIVGGFTTVFKRSCLIATAGSVVLYGAIGPRSASPA